MFLKTCGNQLSGALILNFEELYPMMIISVAKRRKQFSNSLFNSINVLAATSTISGGKPLEYRITPYPNTKKYSRKTKNPKKMLFLIFYRIILSFLLRE